MVLARVILEESLIPAVGGVGLLGNTLTIIVLNRCQEVIFDFSVVNSKFQSYIHLVNEDRLFLTVWEGSPSPRHLIKS